MKRIEQLIQQIDRSYREDDRLRAETAGWREDDRAWVPGRLEANRERRRSWETELDRLLLRWERKHGVWDGGL